VPVVIADGGAAILAVAAETLTTSRLGMLRAVGDVELAVTSRRAETLKIRAYDGDIARVMLPPSAGVDWINAVADPADDLRTPMKGPFKEVRGGNANLAGAAIILAKTARLLPAIVSVAVTDPVAVANQNSLTTINWDTARDIVDGENAMHEVISAHLPLSASKDARLHVFRPDDGGEEHYAIEIGRPDRSKPVLARLHSACFTGDLLGSLKCDCGPQLRGAMQQMGAEGAGVLLYLNQEGRGIGLANKMRAYSLQDQGFDTVEANHRLGFEDDERDFRIGASILKDLGFSSVRLLTNNPAKVANMQANGITVTERVPLMVGETAQNREYLKTKAKKSGHLL